MVSYLMVLLASLPGKKQLNRLALFGPPLAGLLTACGTTMNISKEEIESKYANMSPKQALLMTGRRLEKATSEQYDYFSPSNWKAAAEALQHARTLAKTNPNNKEILKYTFLVDRRIESAQFIKNRVQKTFQALFEIKHTLEDNQAGFSYQKEYASATHRFRKLIADFENLTLGNKTEDATQRAINVNSRQLLNDMRTLNIKVVKFNHLEKARVALQQLEQQQVKDVAPKTYQAAHAAWVRANQFIEQHVDDKQGIERVAFAFRFAVDHVTHVSQTIIELSKKNISELEDVVLGHEQHLYTIGQALHGPDVRDKPLSQQSRAILDAANGVLEHHAEKSAMIVELSEKNLLLQEELKKRTQTDSGANDKLKRKIKDLEQDLAALEKERETLKENIFALEQKNIDLAIQNAKLAAEVEHKNNRSKTDKNSKINSKAGFDTISSGTGSPVKVKDMRGNSHRSQVVLSP